MQEASLFVLTLISTYICYDVFHHIIPAKLGKLLRYRINSLDKGIRKEVYLSFSRDYYSEKSSIRRYMMAASMMLTIRDLAAPRKAE